MTPTAGRISAVIATYNRAAMVKQTVEAALAQTRPPTEIVVMDDCSTDATTDVLAELSAGAGVRALRRAQNSGGNGSWNEAAAAASGDYIAFCADDDRWLPDHLEASVRYLEQHPEAGFVHSGFVDVVEKPGYESVEPRKLRSPEPLEISRDNLIRYMTRYYDWPFHFSTLVLRREVWQQTGELNRAYQLADTDWFVRAVERYRAVLLPCHGVYNRRHPGNWSNRVGSAKMQAEIFEIVEAAIGRLLGERRLHRTAWRAIWRANVRARLSLTLWHRLKSGHGDAACAAWHGILQNTGRKSPVWAERAGEKLWRWCCRGRVAEVRDARRSVSPL
ncbi:MAG TPA: glycosyltransferase family A protein [Bryobacteraceae bacterium]|jgi:glycosyltransferase involved in cell wall biosynthesis